MEKPLSKDHKKKKKISAEEKRTYIAYAIIGIFALGLIIYAVNDFGSDDKNKPVEEFGTPEGEANKYNSKIEALNGGKEQDTTINGDLLGYSTDGDGDKNMNKPVNSHETDLKVSENQTIEKENPLVKESRETKNQSSSRETLKRKNSYTKERKAEEIPAKEYKTNFQEERAPIQEPVTVRQINSSSINNFFSNSKKKETLKQDVIYAEIKGDQMGVRNNQRVTLLLSKDASINGMLFKKNTIIYAKATFTESRVNFTVTSINQNSVLLMGYDAQDGGLGLQVSESLIGETTSGIIDQNANDSGLDDIPVVGRTLNNILRKRNKEVKIDLLNNQKMILKPMVR